MKRVLENELRGILAKRPTVEHIGQRSAQLKENADRAAILQGTIIKLKCTGEGACGKTVHLDGRTYRCSG